MFKTRHLQVKIVRDEEATNNTDSPETNVADIMYIVHETGAAAIKGAIALVAAYVALDTARQVTVNAAPKRH